MVKQSAELFYVDYINMHDNRLILNKNLTFLKMIQYLCSNIDDFIVTYLHDERNE
jgi:hypothetical protein